jgi:hypothetical protein
VGEISQQAAAVGDPDAERGGRSLPTPCQRRLRRRRDS